MLFILLLKVCALDVRSSFCGSYVPLTYPAGFCLSLPSDTMRCSRLILYILAVAFKTAISSGSPSFLYWRMMFEGGMGNEFLMDAEFQSRKTKKVPEMNGGDDYIVTCISSVNATELYT